MTVAAGLHAVLELFDKQTGPFTEEDVRLVQPAAELGTELLRQALGQKQMHRLLFDAVAAALGASADVVDTLARHGRPAARPTAPRPGSRSVAAGAGCAPHATLDADQSLRLAEAIRVLALKYGGGALEHCLQLVQSTQRLLDKTTQID